MTNLGEREFLPEITVQPPERMRRLTVLFRAILLVPHMVVLGALSIAALVVQVLGWFGALFMGRLPVWAHEFLRGYLGWSTRVNAYLYLLVDQYPPFDLDGYGQQAYPVRIELRRGRLNRAAVLFRAILLVPATFLMNFLGYGWLLFAPFLWASVLITGRTPTPVYRASAAMVRYAYRFSAYQMMLTSAYPKRLFGDPPEEPAAVVDGSGTVEHEVAGPAVTGPATSGDLRAGRLWLTRGGRALVVLFVVFGVLGYLGYNAWNTYDMVQTVQQLRNDPAFAAAALPR